MNNKCKIIIAVLLFSLTMNVEGQIKVDLKKKVENAVNRRANQHTDQAINKGLDAVENGVKEDLKKDSDQSTENQGNQEGQAAGKGDQGSGDKSSGQQQTALESYSKYDFIPGEKIIFFDDFSQDAVGDFPALWNTNGSAEVVTTNFYPGNWMKFVMSECVWTDALLKLPENYTIEFDVIPIGGLKDRNVGMVYETDAGKEC